MLDGAGDFRRLEFGDAELAGGDIHVRQAGAAIHARHRGQIIILARTHQVRVHGRAGRDHARDLALHQLLGELRVFHLVADGDAVAPLHQARDVALGGMVGHAAHGNGRAFFLVARGEGDLEFARGDDGVFEKQLVEIAQAERAAAFRELLL